MSIAGESKRRRPLGPLDDYCDELEEEIEELTAELERVKDQCSRQEHGFARRESDLQRELATERAARKITNAHLERAERERDTALARVSAWAMAYDSNGCGPQTPDEVQVFLRERDRVNGQCAELKVSAAERERDTALARVKELEDSKRALRMTNRVEEADADDQRERRKAAETALASARADIDRIKSTRGDRDDWVQAAQRADEARIASDSALTAARTLVATIKRHVPWNYHGLHERIDAWLTSHPAPVAAPRSESRCALSINGQHDWYCKLCMPAPVAAPERGTRDVVETAIDLTKDDKHSRWNALMARTAELPVTVMATSEYPSPAPCSGCAAARELLVLWYHNRAETESGEIIEVATQNWLKEHGNG